jgi:hypothetical protein
MSKGGILDEADFAFGEYHLRSIWPGVHQVVHLSSDEQEETENRYEERKREEGANCDGHVHETLMEAVLRDCSASAIRRDVLWRRSDKKIIGVLKRLHDEAYSYQVHSGFADRVIVIGNRVTGVLGALAFHISIKIAPRNDTNPLCIWMVFACRWIWHTCTYAHRDRQSG